jgi:aryl-alcohol dehydrogenase-like predicted oxidoreductase
LRTDYLDLYWVHFSDGVTPVEEILYAFDGLVHRVEPRNGVPA